MTISIYQLVDQRLKYLISPKGHKLILRWSYILSDLISQSLWISFLLLSRKIQTKRLYQTRIYYSQYSLQFAQLYSLTSLLKDCRNCSKKTRIQGCSTQSNQSLKAYSTTQYLSWFSRRAGFTKIRQKLSRKSSWNRLSRSSKKLPNKKSFKGICHPKEVHLVKNMTLRETCLLSQKGL